MFKFKKVRRVDTEIEEAEKRLDTAYEELRRHLDELSASIEETEKLQKENLKKLQELSKMARG